MAAQLGRDFEDLGKLCVAAVASCELKVKEIVGGRLSLVRQKKLEGLAAELRSSGGRLGSGQVTEHTVASHRSSPAATAGSLK